MLTGSIIVTHSEKEAFFVKNTGNVKENLQKLSEVAPLDGIAINLYLIIQNQKKEEINISIMKTHQMPNKWQYLTCISKFYFQTKTCKMI